MGDKCEKCRVKVQRELTSMKVKMVNGKYLIINNVPNTVCSFCGDRYMSEGTLKMIQYVIDKYTVNINDDDLDEEFDASEFAEFKQAAADNGFEVTRQDFQIYLSYVKDIRG